MKFVNPSSIAAPLSRYSHGVVTPRGGNRLVVSGQVGVDLDGSLADGLEAQMERCWRNLFAVLEDAGMSKRDLVKYTAYCTEPDAIGLFREVRDRMLEGHPAAATYIVVAGLASPDFLIEIEAEAVSG